MVLPVYVFVGRQVETAWADLGTGLREWVEVRHGAERRFCATAAQRDVFLRSHGFDLRDFTEAETVEDGCE